MLRHKVTLALVCGLLAAGCGSSSDTDNLWGFEVEFLREDTVDLMVIAFQIGENAYQGDPVLPGDVLEPAAPINDFFVHYDLPPAVRDGLGTGFGDVYYQVTEDGVRNPNPLTFLFATTTALEVVIVYDIAYQGVSVSDRETDIEFVVTLTATRSTPAGPFEVRYDIEGDCFVGETFCDLDTFFFAPGPPSSGPIEGSGDGEGFVDDPDVYDLFYIDLNYFADSFRAEGDVGCCAFFKEQFYYDDIFPLGRP